MLRTAILPLLFAPALIAQLRTPPPSYGIALMDGVETLRIWDGEGWGLGSDPRLDPDQPQRLIIGDERRRHLFCPSGGEQPLRTRFALGSCSIRGDVLFAKDGAFDLLLPNGSSVGIQAFGVEPGTWVPLEIDFTVDALGKGTLRRLRLGGADKIERPLELGVGTPRGPIGLRDLIGARVSFRDWVVVPAQRFGAELEPVDLAALEPGGFAPDESVSVLSADSEAAAIRLSDDLQPGQTWALELLLAPRTRGVLDVGGVEVVLNRSARGAAKTGSVVDGALVRERLVPDDAARFVVGIRTSIDGAVTVLVNGVETARQPPAARGLGAELTLRRTSGDGPLQLFGLRRSAPK